MRIHAPRLISCGLIASTFLSLTAPAATRVHLDRRGEQWASATLKKMTLEEKIGQMIMPWARIQFMNVSSPDYLLLRDEMRKYSCRWIWRDCIHRWARAAQERAAGS